MKLTYLLFTFYLLLLAGYPCTDEASADGGTTVVAAAHQHQGGEDDHCSPFCICSCCATPVQLAATLTATTALPLHNTALATPYRDTHTVQNTCAIWQPPRRG